MMEEPTAEELAAQLQILLAALPALVQLRKHADTDMEDLEGMEKALGKSARAPQKPREQTPCWNLGVIETPRFKCPCRRQIFS